MDFRPVSDRVVTNIRQKETFRGVAYDDKQPSRTRFGAEGDVIGTPSIGYGHTKGVTKLDVVKGRVCSSAQAEAYLREDLSDTVRTIYAKVGARRVLALSEGQWDALVDFCFNCGFQPKIMQLVRAGRFSEVPAHMSLYVYSGGQRMGGLVDRRRIEVDWWHEASTAPGMGVGVEPAPAAPVWKSRTFVASVGSGVSGLGAAAASAAAVISPHADSSHILQGVLTGCVVVSASSAFLASMFKAQDSQRLENA